MEDSSIFSTSHISRTFLLKLSTCVMSDRETETEIRRVHLGGL